MLTENGFVPEIANRAICPDPRQRNEVIFHGEAGTARSDLEKFIFDKFELVHDAKIREFLPYLVEVRNELGSRAAVGLRPGVSGGFFLQQYLEKPIEQLIAGLTHAPCDRNRLVEIGNFAADSPILGAMLFSVLARSLQEAGFTWMIFTATPDVEKMLAYLNCQPIVLGTADADKLGEGVLNWGNYYRQQPKVMACNLDHAIGIAQIKKRIAKVFSDHADDVSNLACSLNADMHAQKYH